VKELQDQLKKHRLVPVVAIESAADAVPLAEALTAGGLPVAEVTFRTAAAEESIKAIAKSGKMLVGAGTVLNIETAKKAIDAGASFIVTPGFGPKVVEFCLGKKVPIIPGASNATDLQIAIGEYQLSVVKFFPAEAYGGIKTLKALAAPFSSVKFMPTGGITTSNLRAYLEFGPVLACGGSWMVAKELLAARQWDDVRKITAESVALVKELAAAVKK
jgi:2-dehydro-3-deoxyphosphogluconate aldolase/(4S)-4-hydroxy-2-oxoglutarate aldolase